MRATWAAEALWLALALWLPLQCTFAATILSLSVVSAPDGEVLIPDMVDPQPLGYDAYPRGSYNIRANLSPDANFSGSVAFYLDSSLYNVENFVPYSMAGDTDGVYNQLSLNQNTYTVRVDVHALDDGLGAVLSTFTSTVMIVAVQPPSPAPTPAPTALPSGSSLPTSAPTGLPTSSPTSQPTSSPTSQPTSSPTSQPTSSPTSQPTRAPTRAPTSLPTNAPTQAPSSPPSFAPSLAPSSSPTLLPTAAPTSTLDPTVSPSLAPTLAPSQSPTSNPTRAPSFSPTVSPTGAPSEAPTTDPTPVPTPAPTTATPTIAPTAAPSAMPSVQPTAAPSVAGTLSPSTEPTRSPTMVPSTSPSLPPDVTDPRSQAVLRVNCGGSQYTEPTVGGVTWTEDLAFVAVQGGILSLPPTTQLLPVSTPSALQTYRSVRWWRVGTSNASHTNVYEFPLGNNSYTVYLHTSALNQSMSTVEVWLENSRAATVSSPPLSGTLAVATATVLDGALTVGIGSPSSPGGVAALAGIEVYVTGTGPQTEAASSPSSAIDSSGWSAISVGAALVVLIIGLVVHQHRRRRDGKDADPSTPGPRDGKKESLAVHRSSSNESASSSTEFLAVMARKSSSIDSLVTSPSLQSLALAAFSTPEDELGATHTASHAHGLPEEDMSISLDGLLFSMDGSTPARATPAASVGAAKARTDRSEHSRPSLPTSWLEHGMSLGLDEDMALGVDFAGVAHGDDDEKSPSKETAADIEVDDDDGGGDGSNDAAAQLSTDDMGVDLSNLMAECYDSE